MLLLMPCSNYLFSHKKSFFRTKTFQTRKRSKYIETDFDREIERERVITNDSKTVWPDYFFNIWPFSKIKIYFDKNFAKVSSTFCQSVPKFRQIWSHCSKSLQRIVSPCCRILTLLEKHIFSVGAKRCEKLLLNGRSRCWTYKPF